VTHRSYPSWEWQEGYIYQKDSECDQDDAGDEVLLSHFSLSIGFPCILGCVCQEGFEGIETIVREPRHSDRDAYSGFDLTVLESSGFRD